MAVAKVTLDLETFKALASTTRLSVLKTLGERRKTLSEISRDLDLNKATVHEHLAVLVATGLVKKNDEGRKWIYYELSWQGERLLHPQESTTFAVLLGLSVVAAGGSAALFGQALGWWWQSRPPAAIEEGDPEVGVRSAPEADGQPADDQQADAPPDDQNGTSSAMRVEDDRGPSPSMDAPVDDGFWDETGILAILMLLTSALLAFVAWSTRRGKAR